VGHSGGSGRRFSIQSTIRMESATTSPWSAISTGTRSWPLASIAAVRSSMGTSTQSTATDLWARARATRSTLVE